MAGGVVIGSLPGALGEGIVSLFGECGTQNAERSDSRYAHIHALAHNLKHFLAVRNDSLRSVLKAIPQNDLLGI